MNIPAEGIPKEKLDGLLASAQGLMDEYFPNDSVAYLAGIKFFFKDQHGSSIAVGMGDDGYDNDESDLVDPEGEAE